MENSVRTIKQTPQESIYQVGEGAEALTLSIMSGNRNYTDNKSKPKSTKYVALRLSSNGNTLSYFDKQAHTSAIYLGEEDDIGTFYSSRKVDIKRELAEEIFHDNSKGGIALKKLLAQIKENPIAKDLHKLIEKMAQQEEMKKHSNVDAVDKLAALRKKVAHQADKLLGTKLEEKKLPESLKIVSKILRSTRGKE